MCVIESKQIECVVGPHTMTTLPPPCRQITGRNRRTQHTAHPTIKCTNRKRCAHMLSRTKCTRFVFECRVMTSIMSINSIRDPRRCVLARHNTNGATGAHTHTHIHQYTHTHTQGDMCYDELQRQCHQSDANREYASCAQHTTKATWTR